MARNIEVKASVSDMDEMRTRVAGLADCGSIEIMQDDIYFSCSNGRLKLRILSENEGRLIFYKRPDISGPKESFYIISQTGSPHTLRDVLTTAFGQSGRVRKHRSLFLKGRTRIHLDRIEGLGDFLELEVALDEGENQETAKAEADVLLKRLGISDEQLIEGAYVDLLGS